MNKSDYISIIKKKIRIKDLYPKDRGELISTSQGWKALSPFSNEKTPSFNISDHPNGDKWYCFSTSQGGDVLSYYELLNKVDFRTAYFDLCRMAGIEVTNPSSLYFAEDGLFSLESQLIHTHSFFDKRAIKPEVLKKYGVGYIKDIRDLKLSTKVIEKWDLFDIRDSIFYCVKDRSGVSVGYYYRPLSNKKIKYMSNSSLHVWGLNMLSNKSRQAIVVEGQNDVLKLSQGGIPNVLCSSGTVFNSDTLQIMNSHGITKVIYIPDNDSAGDNMIKRIIDQYGTFDTHGITVYYAKINSQSVKNPVDHIDIDKDFYINPPISSPLVTYFNQIGGSNWDKLKEIINNKPFLKPSEIQITLKDQIGGIVDLNSFKYNLYDAKSEFVVISNILSDKFIRESLLVELTPEHFDNFENKRVFSFISDKNNKDCTIDTIKNMFNIDYNQPDLEAHEIYKLRLDEYKNKREISNTIYEFLPRISDINTGSNDVASLMITELNQKISNNDNKSKSGTMAVIGALEMINSDDFTGIQYDDSFPKINSITRGLPRGRLIVFGGQSGSGKTTFATQIVDSISVKNKYRTLFFTGEMYPEEMALKQMSCSLRINMNDILNKKVEITKDQIEEMIGNRIHYAPLPLMENYKQTVEKYFYMYDKFDLVIVDYVQLFKTIIGSKLPRHQQLSGFTEVLKNTAMGMDIPILAMVQLNKESINKKMAEITDIAGAYDMVADADIGMTITRNRNPESMNSLSDGNAIILLDKVRYNTDKSRVNVLFDGSTSSIREVG